MSLFELLVILLVGFLVIKPEDLPKIFVKIKELRSFMTDTKNVIINHIDPKLESIEDDMEQMNYYLEKIAKIGSEYEGEYSLQAIKDYYRNLVKKRIKQEEKNRD